MAAGTATESTQLSDNIYWIKTENEEIECKDSEFKAKFNEQLISFYESQTVTPKKPWTMERILEVIQHVKDNKAAIQLGKRRTSMQYYWGSKYDVSNSDDAEYLIMKKKDSDDPIVRVIPIEQYFDLINQFHIELNHCGRDKICQVIKNKYYVQKKAIEIYIALCPVCELKRSNQKNNAKLRAASFNNSGQLELIDLQSMPDGEYHWLLKYQDCTTKFLYLRPLRTNEITEIASELVKIFLTSGSPGILISTNEQILNEVKIIWPDCNIKHENPIHSCRDLDNLEINNTDITSMLQTWINNNSTNWSLGCHFIQYKINTSTHSSEEKSPYNAVFGYNPCITEKKSVELDIKNEEENEGTNNRLKRAAEKTNDEIIKKKTSAIVVGDTVNVSVPKTDRGPLNTKCIFGIITDINNGVYQVGTKSGIIKNWFPRDRLQLASSVEFKEDVPQNLLTLKEAVTKQTLFGDEAFNKCLCKPSKNQCHNFKCACYKKKILCSSKCHSSLICQNK
ncbi:KRAB-A domain-containing protein 2-like [Amyelois transitella]|uniref:KRAB-A domain-containing protein 2-like n=1 Tax=Amyelois transitella TaxID=680683 RepID=UPI00298FD102|nr:KRAB-A domain-containing protein 2-like [Amyelois transitella]